MVDIFTKHKSLRRQGVMTSKDLADIQQPFAKDGYTNDHFDKLYGHKTKNPGWGTERDRKLRKNSGFVHIPNESELSKCPKCGKAMFIDQEICGECFMKYQDGKI